jgi:hypothetical protein
MYILTFASFAIYVLIYVIIICNTCNGISNICNTCDNICVSQSSNLIEVSNRTISGKHGNPI